MRGWQLSFYLLPKMLVQPFCCVHKGQSLLFTGSALLLMSQQGEAKDIFTPTFHPAQPGLAVCVNIVQYKAFLECTREELSSKVFFIWTKKRPNKELTLFVECLLGKLGPVIHLKHFSHSIQCLSASLIILTMAPGFLRENMSSHSLLSAHLFI